MTGIEIADLLSQWGPSSLPTVAVVVLWIKNNKSEERIAELVNTQAELVRECVKHIERSTVIMERIDAAGRR